MIFLKSGNERNSPSALLGLNSIIENQNYHFEVLLLSDTE